MFALRPGALNGWQEGLVQKVDGYLIIRGATAKTVNAEAGILARAGMRFVSCIPTDASLPGASKRLPMNGAPGRISCFALNHKPLTVKLR